MKHSTVVLTGVGLAMGLASVGYLARSSRHETAAPRAPVLAAKENSAEPAQRGRRAQNQPVVVVDPGAGLREALAGIESRLKHIENAEEPTPSEAEAPARETLSEAALGEWMDEDLRAREDGTRTAVMARAIQTNLSTKQGLQLQEASCGERFCRATLFREDGEAPDLVTVIGDEPFLGEGFGVSEPDGRLSIYFTSVGVTLAELRGEVLDARL